MEIEFDMANFAAEISLIIPDVYLASSAFGFHVPVECPLSAVIHCPFIPGAVLQCTRRPVVIYDYKFTFATIQMPNAGEARITAEYRPTHSAR